MIWIALSVLALVIVVGLRDIFNTKHTIKGNFPVIGRIRYMMEKIRPEIRQYFFEGDRDGQPFSRNQRSYVYASAKGQNNLIGFGTDADFTSDGHFFIRQSQFPNSDPHTDTVGCRKVIGPHRKHPYQPASIINISAMSYGALGWKATMANSIGAREAGAYHNTGEGGFSPFHTSAEQVVFQIGTGYFGCGTTMADGTRKFSMNLLVELVAAHPSIKAIELKLSQGAKAGKGGVLPADKVTEEISAIRGVPMGFDVVSPASHDGIHNVDDLINFVELIADYTGLPVGIKSAVGQENFWHELAGRMAETGRGPDFITIDGGEGGTGAAPSAFADHVGLPFKDAFTTVYKAFQAQSMTEKVVFIASGKLGFPAKAAMAFAMGADMINIAREIMLSAGCIQAKQCHLGTCPAGIATHNWWLQRNFNVKDKSSRIGRFIKVLRTDILSLTYAAGYKHPSEFMMEDIVMNTGDKNLRRSLADIYGYEKVKLEVISRQQRTA